MQMYLDNNGCKLKIMAYVDANWEARRLVVEAKANIQST
jgi:hypothetical protein